MSKKKKITNSNLPKLPLDYLEEENSTVSAHECTGLIPNGIKTEAQSESYKELYNVYQPDNRS